MKINNFLIADKIYKDPKSGKLNIEGLFDIIYTKSFPAIHKELFILIIFEGPNKKYNYHLSLKYGSKIVMEDKLVVDKKTGRDHNIITQLKNVPLLEADQYAFEVKLDKQIIQKTIKIQKI